MDLYDILGIIIAFLMKMKKQIIHENWDFIENYIGRKKEAKMMLIFGLWQREI